jgi:VanZ family protein
VPGIHEFSSVQHIEIVDGRDKPGHDRMKVVELTRSKLLAVVGAVLLAAIAVAALIPVGWQVRTGLHWLVEHFLAFFTVTLVFCLAWPRPMRVAAVMLPLALAIETLQALTPDRTADLATALMAATGVAVAALFADLVISLRKR